MGRAAGYLSEHPRCAVVCGRRRERTRLHPRIPGPVERRRGVDGWRTDLPSRLHHAPGLSGGRLHLARVDVPELPRYLKRMQLLENLLREHKLDSANHATGLKLNAMSCVALPTCGLALAESERFSERVAGKAICAIGTSHRFSCSEKAWHACFHHGTYPHAAHATAPRPCRFRGPDPVLRPDQLDARAARKGHRSSNTSPVHARRSRCSASSPRTLPS